MKNIFKAKKNSKFNKHFTPICEQSAFLKTGRIIKSGFFIAKNKLILVPLVIICLFLIINPSICSKTCLDAISVWTFKIFPVMFPFFILTRLILSVGFSYNPLDRFFNKIYNTPKGSLNVFLLSVLSGYPMGAKMVCNLYEDGKINKQDIYKMLSFCSICGPMFMIGTVGVNMLDNKTSGVIILISNILACLINGLIFKGKKENNNYIVRDQKIDMANCMYDSIISILSVAGYLIFSFIIIALLNHLNIIPFICAFLANMFKIDKDIIQSIFVGIIEITEGNLLLSKTSISLGLKTIISSGIIGFGGISVMLQSLNFLSKCNIDKKIIIKQKIIQGILSFLLCFIIVKILHF